MESIERVELLSMFYETAAIAGIISAILLAVVRLPRELRHERGIRYERAARIAFVWAVFAACFYCHTRFGSSLKIDPSLPRISDLRPLLTVAIDFGIAAIGLWVTFKFVRFQVPRWFERGITQWAVGLFMGVVGYWVLTSAQNSADERIRAIVHISPERLPEAQRTLTLMLAILGWLTWLSIGYYLGALIVFFSNFKLRTFHAEAISGLIPRLTRALLSIAPIFIVPVYLSPAISAIFQGANVTEGQVWAGMIVSSSFIKNRPDEFEEVLGGANNPHSKICLNLGPTALIAFVNPNDPVPATVLLADEQKTTLSFRLVLCENSSNPYRLK